MISSVQIAATATTMDAGAITRTVQGIIVGIGFLGGGVIVKGDREGGVRNLTTAASIWIAATLGVCAGAGQWAIVLGVAVISLLVLTFGGPIEHAAGRMFGTRPTEKDAHAHANEPNGNTD